MINIDKIDIFVIAHAANNANDIRNFGRFFSFTKGLNLVVGDNSLGKSTIVKCMMYALGLEELIEGKIQIVSLDKSVKDHLEYVDDNGNKSNWMVDQSYVRIQISNDRNEQVTIKRFIKSSAGDALHVLHVWMQPMVEEMNIADSTEYYVHREADNNHEYGFYNFLSEFADLPVITVPGRNGMNAKLYIQTIFSSAYIEQKRGWSDFFANIRSFNIINPRQQLIEYIMGYKTNNELLECIGLREIRKKLKEQWKTKVLSLKNLLAYHGCYATGLQEDIVKQKNGLNNVRFMDKKHEMMISERLNYLVTEIEKLVEKVKVQEYVKDDEEYERMRTILLEHRNEYDKYCCELINEIDKLENIQNQFKNLEEELLSYRCFEKVNNVISTMDVKLCPICHQPLPSIDRRQNDIITLDTLRENIDLLSKQKNFFKSLVEKQEYLVKNKQLNKHYLEIQLRQEEQQLELLTNFGNKSVSPLTSSEQFKMIRYIREQESLKVLEKHIESSKLCLNEINSDYKSVDAKIKEKKIVNEDNEMFSQLSLFRQLLNTFNYTSNDIVNSVFFKEEQNNYKYLPVIREGDSDIEEEIRSNSSASDFIRSIWAYYLTLIKNGSRHPGFLIMDEPCQQSINESSLQNLFNECTGITDKQIILFCSSQPRIVEGDNPQSFLISNLIDTARNNGCVINSYFFTDKSIAPLI